MQIALTNVIKKWGKAKFSDGQGDKIVTFTKDLLSTFLPQRGARGRRVDTAISNFDNEKIYSDTNRRERQQKHPVETIT